MYVHMYILLFSNPYWAQPGLLNKGFQPQDRIMFLPLGSLATALLFSIAAQGWEILELESEHPFPYLTSGSFCHTLFGTRWSGKPKVPPEPGFFPSMPLLATGAS